MGCGTMECEGNLYAQPKQPKINPRFSQLLVESVYGWTLQCPKKPIKFRKMELISIQNRRGG